MSGSSNVSQASAPPSPGSSAGADSRVSESGVRWAALDSHHERLVTASDPVLAELGRKETAGALLAS
jgi:hypothetical protein